MELVGALSFLARMDHAHWHIRVEVEIIPIYVLAS